MYNYQVRLTGPLLEKSKGKRVRLGPGPAYPYTFVDGVYTFPLVRTRSGDLVPLSEAEALKLFKYLYRCYKVEWVKDGELPIPANLSEGAIPQLSGVNVATGATAPEVAEDSGGDNEAKARAKKQ